MHSRMCTYLESNQCLFTQSLPQIYAKYIKYANLEKYEYIHRINRIDI